MNSTKSVLNNIGQKTGFNVCDDGIIRDVYGIWTGMILQSDGIISRDHDYRIKVNESLPNMIRDGFGNTIGLVDNSAF